MCLSVFTPKDLYEKIWFSFTVKLIKGSLNWNSNSADLNSCFLSEILGLVVNQVFIFRTGIHLMDMNLILLRNEQFFLLWIIFQLEAGGYTDTSRDPSPEPSSQSVAIKSNMFKPAAPSRSPETRLSSSNLNLSGSHRSPTQDGSAAVVRSKSPATLGFGNNNKATHLTPTFINNNNTRMDKDLETRLRGVKLNQNGSGKSYLSHRFLDSFPRILKW